MRTVWALWLCFPALAFGNSLGGVGMDLTAAPRTPQATFEARPKRSITSMLSLESNAMTVSGQYGKPRGILGNTPLTFGPKVSALGLPSPFRGGLEAKWDNTFGLGFDFGYLPLTGIKDTRVTLNSWTGTARYYPWRGPFYFGVGAGKQNFQAGRSSTFGSSTYQVSLDVNSVVVVPQVGWRWVWESGFYMGMEVGVQVSLSTSQSVTTDAAAIIQSTAEYQAQIKNVTDQANVVAKLPLPHFAVLQVGYFF